MQRMRPFFSYFGSKWRLAPKYPKPLYDVICEPFAGSAQYSTFHGADKTVFLVEQDSTIAGIWEYLIDATPEMIEDLPVVYSPNFEQWITTMSDIRAINLIGMHMQKGGVSPARSPNTWMLQYPTGGFWGERMRARIASQVLKIKHWIIKCNSYKSALEYGECTWFIDPPYRGAGASYKHSLADDDYEQLATWCRSLPGQVIVCEHEGANWLPFEPLAEQRVMSYGKGEDGRRRRTEMYWTNINER